MAGEYSVSQPVPRHEDPRLLRGGGKYLDDINFAGQLYGYVVRSPQAHAKILQLSTHEAEQASGVVAVLTAKDYLADGLGRMPVTPPPNPAFDMKTMFAPRRLPLAEDRVRHIGEPIAFVVARSYAEARDAGELIEVNYHPLPAVTDMDAALKADAPILHDGHTDNVSFVYEIGDADAVDAAFATAAHVIKQRIHINRVAPSSLEPRGCVAQYDGPSHSATIHVGVQQSFNARRLFAQVIFNEPENSFRIIPGDMGGGFGMKGAFYSEYVLTAWAARRLGRPVKWYSDRSEAFLSDNHGRDNLADGELALDKDGNFLALRVRTKANLGAWPSTTPSGPPTAALGGLIGMYKTPAAHVRVTGVFTNTTPTGAYRGAGRPEAAYIIERLVDRAARELKIDPVDLRRKNLIPSSAMPYQSPIQFKYDSGDFANVLKTATEHADYAGYAQRREQSKKSGKLRGLGISATLERSAAAVEYGEIRFDPAGSVTVLTGNTNMGTGHATIFAQLVYTMLGVKPEQVRVVEGDTGLMPFGGGTGGSRVSSVGMSAVKLAAEKVIAKAKTIAAHTLEAAEADIVLENGVFSIAGTDRRIGLVEIAQKSFNPANLPKGMEPGLMEGAMTPNLLPAYPNAVHICELEVDPDTGKVDMQRYTVADDVGVVLNPLLLEGQVRGGIAQGAGQILLENVAFEDGTGQLLTGSFMDYAMPRANDLCEMHSYDASVPSKNNPIGSKGAGEGGTVGAMPAVMNAIIDALSAYGVTNLDMPATPERIWRAINGR
jgi:aerobic carbon-monoxide dehydrogenase large subunit